MWLAEFCEGPPSRPSRPRHHRMFMHFPVSFVPPGLWHSPVTILPAISDEPWTRDSTRNALSVSSRRRCKYPRSCSLQHQAIKSHCVPHHQLFYPIRHRTYWQVEKIETSPGWLAQRPMKRAYRRGWETRRENAADMHMQTRIPRRRVQPFVRSASGSGAGLYPRDSIRII